MSDNPALAMADALAVFTTGKPYAQLGDQERDDLLIDGAVAWFKLASEHGLDAGCLAETILHPSDPEERAGLANPKLASFTRFASRKQPGGRGA